MSDTIIEAQLVHDTIIVGAGPCGLAVAARLCEDTPSAIFTDEEHRRYHWIQKHAAKATIKNKKTGMLRLPKEGAPLRRGSAEGMTHECSSDILVLDNTGQEWMAKWKMLFKKFQISHLRSPMFFHVDPNDRDGLLAYTHEQARDRELVEITGCVGKEISKHKQKKTNISKNKTKSKGFDACRCATKLPTEIDERDRKDYFTPSTPLFHDYCESIIKRYNLNQDLIKKQSVLDIDYGDFSVDTSKQVFKVTTDTGIHYARTVVLAIGAGSTPRLPPSLAEGPKIDGACHAFVIDKFPDPSVIAKMKRKQTTNIVVVGGGLTSAQVAEMAIEKGVTKVWHLMRGPIKIKPFDVDLSWMGKFKNQEKASFWSADTDTERLDMINEARGGGSIPSRWVKLLKQHAACGRLALHQNTIITEQIYDAQSQSWKLKTEPPIEGMPQVDYIYYATGVAADVGKVPMLQTLHSKFPIESVGGLPRLTEDLMWRDDVPLFMTGRLAALRLGPGAGNLEGARMGAERVAWGMGDVLKEGREGSGSSEGVEVVESEEDFEYCYHAGIGSVYSCLGEDDGCGIGDGCGDELESVRGEEVRGSAVVV